MTEWMKKVTKENIQSPIKWRIYTDTYLLDNLYDKTRKKK